jgi:hypothetical protein
MYKLEQTMLDFFIDGCHFRVFELPEKFLLIADTIYGKLVAVIMIILYTSINNIYGLFVCLLVVYYHDGLYSRINRYL